MKLLFSDLIDVASAQKLMDGYYAVTHIPTGIIDGEGRVWTATGWLDICTKFHRVNPRTAERCRESDTYIKHHLEAGRPYVNYTCAHGLTDVACPIVVAGQHVAQVMTGQLLLREPDIEFFRGQAREFGFDEEAYLKALAEVPVITEEKLAAIMQFLAQLARFFADMGEKRLKELEAQERVRASEELYAAIFAHIGCGVTMLSPDMEIIFMNSTMKNWFPHVDATRRPICYKSFNLPPREEVCAYCPTIQTLRDGEVHTAITDTPTADGICHYRVISTPVLSANGTITGVVEVVEDITKRMVADEALRQKEIYLQGILEATADGILAVDDQGRIIKANRRFAELWKIPRELIEANEDARLLEFVLDQLVDPDAFMKRVNSLYGTDSSDTDTILFKDGRVFERNTSPLVRESAVIGRVWSFRDVTFKRKMEEEIFRAQKLESVGLLAGGIAHDFNNLLTAILGNISLAKAQLPEEERTQARLREAEKASLRAKELTQQLLTFAKGGAPVRRSASVADLIRETANFALSGSNVRCRFAIDPELHQVEIDEGQISQVIHNLVINADQAMPVGGTLNISCAETILSAGEVPPLKAGRYVRITVSDQGVGIPAEHLLRIFDPYFTTKEKGRGLGLASAYSIIRNHDGQITVTSRAGEGTAFAIHLPMAEGGVAEKHAAECTLRKGSGRILVMDDEEAVLEIAGAMLSHLGYDCDYTRSGEEAAALYRQEKAAGKPFSAVIADLTIPGGMGGKELVERMQEFDNNIRVIASSGYSNDPIMSEYSSYGFSAVITKPYRIEDLSEVLATVLG